MEELKNKMWLIGNADYEAFCQRVIDSGFTYDRATEKYLSDLKKLAEFEGYYDDAREEFAALERKLKHDIRKDLAYDYNKTYTKAGAGNMIAIMGENLGGALHVYVNNQALNINPTMNTNTSIIVTIPSEDNGFKLTGLYGGTDIIRVVTRGGEATYGFKRKSKPEAHRRRISSRNGRHHLPDR